MRRGGDRDRDRGRFRSDDLPDDLSDDGGPRLDGVRVRGVAGVPGVGAAARVMLRVTVPCPEADVSLTGADDALIFAALALLTRQRATRREGAEHKGQAGRR